METEHLNDKWGEYLSGKWLSTSFGRYNFISPAGLIKLEKILPAPDTDEDKYFPNLARLIKKFNSD